ncbi:hypothetical protein MN116_005716 [Schistosoma mekongi]|uniref:Calmodulin-binding domain-containing protein n=1 Tax=Schistosoma mekongi TaxID=38744 RepID=A0AAE1ZAB9_SCHME|nr:hypothetical protein MN116_005716 [Schistosoma mekongi]
MDEKIKKLNEEEEEKDDDEDRKEKKEGLQQQVLENKVENLNQTRKPPYNILDDYDLRGFKRFSYLLHNQPSDETDSFEIFQSVDSSKFLENIDDFKHSTSGSWYSVLSSTENVDTTNNINKHSSVNSNNNNNNRQINEQSCNLTKPVINRLHNDNSSHNHELQPIESTEYSSSKSFTEDQSYHLQSDSNYDATLHKFDLYDNELRRFEVRKQSKASILSNNQFRRTKFLKNKYINPNNPIDNDEIKEYTLKSSCKLKRTATEHITNQSKYNDNNESSLMLHHSNDGIIIPDNAIIIRRKSTIRCLYPRQHSDVIKYNEYSTIQPIDNYTTDENNKSNLLLTSNINNNLHEYDKHLNEYHISENLKSSFEKDDELKTDNLLEREAHIGALALAWASGKHKTKKSTYDKLTLTSDTTVPMNLQCIQHTNNKSTMMCSDNLTMNNFGLNKYTTTTTNNNNNNKMNLSTLREFSASLFTPTKRNIINSIHRPNSVQLKKTCYSFDETSSPVCSTSTHQIDHDRIQFHTTNKHTYSNNSNQLIPQSIKQAIIKNTAKIAVTPIISYHEDDDNHEDIHQLKIYNKHYYHSMDSMPRTFKQNDKQPQKNDRFYSMEQSTLYHHHHHHHHHQQQQQHQNEELMKMHNNESQLIHSKKSSVQSEPLLDINNIIDRVNDDDDDKNRPIGIRAKIRRNAEDLRSLYGTGGPLGSVQPQMNYKSSNRGIGWRLHWRKIFNERRRKLADYSLFFAVMGILLMVFELEMIMAKVYLRTSIYSILIKSLISASTLILVGLTLVYHAVDIQLFCINNCIEDWRIAMNCRKIFLTLIEVFICLIHPPPILSNYNIYSYTNSYYPKTKLWSIQQQIDNILNYSNSLLSSNSITMNSYYNRLITTPTIDDSLLHNHTHNLLLLSSSSSSLTTVSNDYLPFLTVSTETYLSDDIHYEKPMPIIILELTFSIPMFLRLYLIFRVLLLHSTMFTDAGSRSIGALNRVKINVRFVLKTLATVCPGTMLLIFILSMWIVTSWIMRVCEREQNKEYEKLLNSMWLIAVTFLSIGYGDMVPNTNCGRAISVLAGVMGSACTALVVAVVARKLELTRAEKHVHNFMQDNKFYKNLRHSAANVLRETWLFYKYTRLVKRVKPARVRRHQRKFLTAISRLRKAKDNQRKLKEDASSMVDLAKLQTSIYETVNHIRADQTIFVQRLVAVEKCMSSIQVYVNQMSDTFTGIIDTLGTCNTTTVPLDDDKTLTKLNLSSQSLQQITN